MNNKEKYKHRMTVDQQDSLSEFVLHGPVDLLCGDVVNHLCGIMEERVLSFDLGSRSDRELTIEKARAEGARKLQLELKTYLLNYKATLLNTKR